MRDVADNFYAERGVTLLSMEVTRFEAVDAETKAAARDSIRISQGFWRD